MGSQPFPPPPLCIAPGNRIPGCPFAPTPSKVAVFCFSQCLLRLLSQASESYDLSQIPQELPCFLAERGHCYVQQTMQNRTVGGGCSNCVGWCRIIIIIIEYIIFPQKPYSTEKTVSMYRVFGNKVFIFFALGRIWYMGETFERKNSFESKRFLFAHGRKWKKPFERNFSETRKSLETRFRRSRRDPKNEQNIKETVGFKAIRLHFGSLLPWNPAEYQENVGFKSNPAQFWSLLTIAFRRISRKR